MLHRLHQVWTFPLVLSGIATTLLAVGARAQQLENQPDSLVNLSTPYEGDSRTHVDQKAGSTAKSSVGIAGQRQQYSQGIANIKPMARLETRVTNRVQSRIRNRIDRFYDPQANATAPFRVAVDQEHITLSRTRP